MKKLLLLLFIIPGTVSVAQVSSILAGPMIGHVEFRTAVIWFQATPGTKYTLKYAALQTPTPSLLASMVNIENVNGSNIFKYTIGGLQPGTTYRYDILSAGKLLSSGTFKTQQLWQWRKPAPDFSFIAGSCSYFNDPEFDRVGKPYGGDSSIFNAMAREKSDFMLWLGDNWYTREVDFYSEWGLNNRAFVDRSMKVVQPLLKAMPQYAIWDDHDYGPNNADKSYHLKSASRDVFRKFWCNPSYGENEEGVYTKITWNDVDVFMLDNRWFRSNDLMKDSIDGEENKSKRMFGQKQMEWLKNALLESKYNTNIGFRIIATGSQVLNPLSTKDCLVHYPVEFNELIAFITTYKIDGVVFLTGDRHHSEIIKLDRPGSYSLYDITASPLTAGVSRSGGIEKNNPFRVGPEITEQNYARLSFSGQKQDRTLKVEFLDIRGEVVANWSITKKELSGNR